MGNSEQKNADAEYVKGLRQRAATSSSTFLKSDTGLRRQTMSIILTPDNDPRGPWMSSPDITDILVVDRGPEGGEMKCGDLQYVLSSKFAYEITPREIKLLGPIEKYPKALNLEEIACSPAPERVKKPPMTEVKATWIEQCQDSGAGNNILGDNGRLYIDATEIIVPSVHATSEYLSYYGAFIVPHGSVVRFPSRHFPIFQMVVGEKYIDEFIMTPEGGGFYLEYHRDQPHFHRVLRGGNGIYLLGGWNEEKTHIQMTGFRLGVGDAVYTKCGAIHCDSNLFGEELQVGYTIARDFSTALLRFSDNDSVQIRLNFSPQDYTPLSSPISVEDVLSERTKSEPVPMATATHHAAASPQTPPRAFISSSPAGLSSSPAGLSSSPAGLSSSPAGLSSSPVGLSSSPVGLSSSPGSIERLLPCPFDEPAPPPPSEARSL